jgi:hypothetical protein
VEVSIGEETRARGEVWRVREAKQESSGGAEQEADCYGGDGWREEPGGQPPWGKGGRRPRVQIEDDGGNETITLFGWAEQLVGVRRTYVMLGGRRYG